MNKNNSFMRGVIGRCVMVLSTFLMSSTVWACNFSNSVYSNLDYGLYWFDSNNNCKKANPGQANSYYNKNNKVLIYIHGWQNGATQRKERETFNYTGASGPSNIMSKYWRDRGYNVGVLYWNQFADESEVKDAEAKMWTKNGPRQMRWRDSNGNYRAGPNKSVVDLLFDAYSANLAGYNGSEIRIAGHSLGNQAAVLLTRKIFDANLGSRLKPKRVALLDPFYSNGGKSYLGGKWVGEKAREHVSYLKGKGVIFEAYRSSSASNTFLVGDANTGLLNMTAFVELKPWYFNFFQQKEKHIAAVWHYMWSMNFSEPSIKNSSDKGLSARTSNSRTKNLMNGNKRLIHDLGAYSKTPSDDRFKYGNRL